MSWIFLSISTAKRPEIEAKLAKIPKNCHFDILFDLLGFVKSKCKNILTCRLHRQLALEQYFILLMDCNSFFKSEVSAFFVQNCPIYNKIVFFSPASSVSKKNLSKYRSKIFLPSARAGKTLQFDHQFYAVWSIQSGEILKFVKNVKIATEIEAAIFPSYPFIFEMLSNLNEK